MSSRAFISNSIRYILVSVLIVLLKSSLKYFLIFLIIFVNFFEFITVSRVSFFFEVYVFFLFYVRLEIQLVL